MAAIFFKRCLSCFGVEQIPVQESRVVPEGSETEASPQLFGVEHVQDPAAVVTGDGLVTYTVVSDARSIEQGTVSADAMNEADWTTVPVSDLPATFTHWVKLAFRRRSLRRAFLLRKKDSKVLAAFYSDSEGDDVVLNEPIGAVYIASTAYAANAILGVLFVPRRELSRALPHHENSLSNNDFGHQIWSITGARGFQLTVYHLGGAPDHCVLVTERNSAPKTLAEDWLRRRRVMRSHLSNIVEAINANVSTCSL
ncbi:hypothetical protein F1559_000428 [Cyanidiococcus yangmingshanensis]|uniref:Uncharacterized protein n=1 Tax=Cyanidiococcus yangmingshanensis TaxID=2690220 RepID=A0A7J7IE90_9RHOD|nr:hypothetical protein F1559_000428 [Cyanidiococcus yangmingshanensis]